MMKLAIVAVAFSLVFVTVVKADELPSRDDIVKLMRLAAENCYEDEAETTKVEFTEGAFESLITSDPNPPRNSKCMRYCVMKSHNMYNEDGTINASQVQAILKNVYSVLNNDEAMKTVEDIAEKCMAKVDVDERCEKAHQTAMCMILSLADKGIDIKKL